MFLNRFYYHVNVLYWLISLEIFHVKGPLIPGDKSTGGDSTNASREYMFLFVTESFMKDHELADLGLRLQKEKRYEEALVCFTKANMKNPTHPRHYRLRGNCFLEMERWQEAIDDFREVLKLVPDDKIDKLVLCRALFDAEKYSDAVLETFELGDIDEIMKLADKLTSKSQYDEAVRCYTLTMMRNPVEAKYYKLRGSCFVGKGEFENAMFDFYQALLLDPTDEQNRFNLKQSLNDFGEMNEGVKEILNHLNDEEVKAIGNAFHFHKKYEEAVHCFSVAIEKSPSVSRYYRLRGQSNMELRKLDRAANDFHKALQVDPQDDQSRAHLRKVLFEIRSVTDDVKEIITILTESELETLAENFSNINKFTTAIVYYTAAIEKNPGEAKYYRCRGRCYLRSKNVNMAMSDFQQMINIDPRNRNYRNYLKNTLMSRQVFNQVSEEILNLLTDDELVSLGSEFFFSHHLDEALRCYNLALEKSPYDIRYYKQRANCFWEMRDVDRSIADLRKIVEIDPNEKENHQVLCQALLEANKFNELINEMSALDDIDELVKLGNKFATMRNYNEAIRCFSLVIGRNPYEIRYYRLRGKCYTKLKNFQQAVIDFHQAVQLDPLNEDNRILLKDALYNLGTINESLDEIFPLLNDFELAKLGDNFLTDDKCEEALHYFTEAIKKNSREPHYYSKRSFCYKRRNSLDEAISDLKKTIEMKPKNVRYRVDLIETLFDAGRYDEAEIALQIDTDDPLMQGVLTKMETIKTRQRVTKLVPYVRNLIIQDMGVKISAARRRESNSEDDDNEELEAKVEELKSLRNNYMRELAIAYDEYTSPKTYERKLSESGSKSFSNIEIPDYYIDKITLDLINDPVVTPRGITYDKPTLIQYLRDNKIDPTSRDRLYENQLRPNHALKEAVESWKRKHI